jgi:hypothetical protein
MCRDAGLWLLLSVSLVLPCLGAPQTSDSELAGSKEPYFEAFTVQIPHKEQEGQAVYNHGAFDWNSHPTVALIPDGRIFMVWLPSIGFARGDRLAGTFSSDGGKTWSEAIELINNPDRDDGDPTIIVDGMRLVVISLSIRMPERWDKFNPFPAPWDRNWWYMTLSDDDGKTWSTPVEVTRPHLWAGKRCNGMRLEDGALLLPYYYVYGSEEGNIPKLERDARSAAGMVRSTDGGKTWTSGAIMRNCGADDCDEPAAALLPSGELYCLMRTRTDHLYESHSHDHGLTWEPPMPSPILAGKDSPFALFGLGGDELVVAYNYPDRYSLFATYSQDGGKTWNHPRLIVRTDPGLHYYADNPEIGKTKDGIILVAWQQETLPRHLGKEVRMARLNRAWLLAK